MSDPLSRYESVIDEQIRLAQERGEFDDLPGTGKPLRNLGNQDDELWWLKDYLRREGLSGEALLPPGLALRKEIERLPETVRGLPSEQVVREHVAELNLRIVEWLRAPSGPFLPIGPVDADTIAAGWRDARAAIAPTPEPAEPTDDPAPRRGWWRRVTGRRAAG